MRTALLLLAIFPFIPALTQASGEDWDVHSSDRGGVLQASIAAELAIPWDMLRQALGEPAEWCRIATLVPDTDHCEYRHGTPARVILEISRQDGERDPVRLEHELRLHAGSGKSLQAELVAPSAPLGVRNAGVWISAVASGETHSSVRLRYAYEPSIRSRLATGTYLNTAGRNKIGLTQEATGTDDDPDYIRGARALVERNAARYLLALEAALSTTSREEALHAWYRRASHFASDLPERTLEMYLHQKLTPR